MNETHYLLSIGGIAVTALLCQWLAWRVRLPAILFLLLAGIVAGPISGLLDPQALFDKHLLPLSLLAVALILFEGSLTLKRAEWRDIGKVVQRLVTVGTLTTWVVIALGSHWLFDFPWSLAVLFGCLTLVTGPTVVVPMLRVMNAKASVANILRWEGIAIDPLGALLAVVVFSFIIHQGNGEAWEFGLLIFARVLACGCALGALGGWLLGLALRHQLLPNYLHSLAAITAVFGIFIGANLLASESGLLAVTVMGIWLANMPGVNVRPIQHFKENLSVLLISGLFILLAARLDLNALLALGPATVLLLLLIQFVARPLAVWLSTLGSGLSWRERAMLAWVAPRGIVAAAVSAIFAERLQKAGFAQAESLVPLTFLVIIGTVILQGATVRSVAKLLRVAEPEPAGFLLVSASPFARALGRALQNLGVPVLLTDSNWENIRAARMDHLPTYYGNPTSQDAETNLNLIGIGQLLTLSPSDDLNMLVCMHFRHDFAAEQRFTLPAIAQNPRTHKHRANTDARGRPLGSQPLSLRQANSRLAAGAKIRNTLLSSCFSWPDYQRMHGQQATLLLGRDPRGRVHVASQPLTFQPGEGWTLVALIETAEGNAITLPLPTQTKDEVAVSAG